MREPVSPRPPSLLIPWHLRQATSHSKLSSFRFLSSSYFWLKVELAARVAILACAPVMWLSLSDETGNFFLTKTLSATIAGVTASQTVGQAWNFTIQLLKSIMIFLPLATAAAALHLSELPVLWAFVYFLVMFLFGIVCEGFNRRLCLLLFNMAMVAQFGHVPVSFAAELSLDMIVGLAFGLGATILPFPRRSQAKAEHKLRQVATNCSTCFHGLCRSFWCESNTQRGMNLNKVNLFWDKTRDTVGKISVIIRDAEYEPGAGLDYICARKVLFQSLLGALESLQRVGEALLHDPSIVEHSEDAKAVGEFLSGPLQDLATAADEAVDQLGHTSHETLDVTNGKHLCQSWQKVMTSFENARKEIFFSSNKPHALPQPYVTLLGYYLFSLEAYVKLIIRFYQTWGNPEKSPGRTFWLRMWIFFTDPFVGTWNKMKRLFLIHGTEEMRIVKEAAKTSVAMIVGIWFFFILDAEKTSMTGPTVIAFISGANTGEAMMASVMRLFGTLIGAVIGLFASSIAETTWEFVIATAIVVFLCTFFRTGKTYGGAAFYATFVVVSMLVPGQSDKAGLMKIQQNTFGVIIYVLIASLVFPTMPSNLLLEHRTKTLADLARLFGTAMHLPKMFVATRGQMKGVEHDAFIASLNSCTCDVQLLMIRNEAELGVMPQAEAEPALRRNDFPTRASRAFHAIEVSMTGFVAKILAAWKLYSSRELDATPQLLSFIEGLCEFYEEIGKTAVELLDLLCISLREMHTELSREQVARSQRLMVLCELFAKRRNEEIVKLITQFQQQRLVTPNEGEELESREPIVKTAVETLVLPTTNDDIVALQTISFCLLSMASSLTTLCSLVDEVQQSELDAL